MEAWFIADLESLKSFYAQGFQENSVPRDANVEIIEKNRLEDSLKNASRNTSKREYKKIKHADKLLELLNVKIVRQKSKYCDRMFRLLEDLI